ncbi:MAG: hypothetical protein C0516_03245 [Gemmatimonas sp.]|nr:hypothetical protein [Gemmatimonas sp.]
MLTERHRIIQRAALEAQDDPRCLKPDRGGCPLPTATTLQIEFFRQWFNNTDRHAEDMRYDFEWQRAAKRPSLRCTTRAGETTIVRPLV